MTERIHLILKAKNITASKFADEVGVQRSSISHILSGRNNPSLDVVQKILKKFPDISTEWLLSGKGPMSNLKAPELFDELSSQDIDISKQPSMQIDLFKTETLKNEEKNSETTINVASRHFNDEVKTDEEIYENNNIKLDNNNMQNISEPQSIKLEDEPQTQYLKDKKNSTNESDESFSHIIKPGKNIDKIVIFYTDKTFSWYNPIE